LRTFTVDPRGLIGSTEHQVLERLGKPDARRQGRY
jgi:hypothetical protein